jgi:hypothetical protein
MLLPSFYCYDLFADFFNLYLLPIFNSTVATPQFRSIAGLADASYIALAAIKRLMG